MCFRWKPGTYRKLVSQTNNQDEDGSSSSAPSLQPFIIFVSMPTGVLTLSLTCLAPTSIVLDIKTAIRDRQGIPRRLQRILYAGSDLEDHFALSHCGVAHGSTVQLAFRLRGGVGRGTKKQEKGDKKHDKIVVLRDRAQTMLKREMKNFNCTQVKDKAKWLETSPKDFKQMLKELNTTQINALRDFCKDREKYGERFVMDLANHLYPEVKALYDLAEECEHAKTALHSVFNLRFTESYMTNTGRMQVQDFSDDIDKIINERMSESLKNLEQGQQSHELDQEVERRVQERLAAMNVLPGSQVPNQQGGDVAMQG